MIEKFKLKDGRFVVIKRLSKSDYEINNNYEFVHKWLRKVSKFLAKEFKEKNLEKLRENYIIFCRMIKPHSLLELCLKMKLWHPHL